MNGKITQALSDYSLKTAGDVAAGLVKRAGKPLFGEPVNKPLSKPFKLDEYDGETPPEYA